MTVDDFEQEAQLEVALSPEGVELQRSGVPRAFPPVASLYQIAA